MVSEENKRCGWWNLRVGCLFLAYLRLMVNLVMPVFLMVDYKLACKTIEVDLEKESLNTLCIIVAASVINIALNILLIIGIHKKHGLCVKLFMAYALIMIILSIVFFGISLNSSTTAMDIVKCILSLLVQLVYVLVIRTYYLKMTAENQDALDEAAVPSERNEVSTS